MSTDRFVLQCSDTVGWTVEPVKIFSEVTCVGLDVEAYSLTHCDHCRLWFVTDIWWRLACWQCV